METLKALLSYGAAIIALPPLVIGLINKTKAFVGGRKGPPILQSFHDNLKLLRKSAVYGQTTGWVFKVGPVASLSAVLMAAALTPFFGAPLFSFNGDAVLFIFLLSLVHFTAVLAALDTGSSLEGMGASRAVSFSTLSDLALILVFANLAFQCGSLSLKDMFSPHDFKLMAGTLTIGSLFILTLAENSRIPIDDPQTHLELTMIHEVMTLDHGGPDLGFISYAAQLKLALMSALIARLMISHLTIQEFAPMFLLAFSIVAVLIGLIESSMARLRMNRAPQLLVAAACASALGLIVNFQ